MNYSYLFGVLVGIAIGIFLLIAFRKKGNCKEGYDERQLIIRGKAYQYGFFSILVTLIGIAIVAELKGTHSIDPILYIAIPMTVGPFVFAMYAIIKDAFLGMGDSNRMLALYFFVFVANAFGAYGSVKGEENAILNLCMCFLFGSVLIALLIKRGLEKER